jgi:chemotaxis methyl-accepting protein methylase
MTGPLQAIFCREGLVPLVESARKRVAAAVKELLGEEGVLCTSLTDEALAESDLVESDNDSDLLAPGNRGEGWRRHGHC